MGWGSDPRLPTRGTEPALSPRAWLEPEPTEEGRPISRVRFFGRSQSPKAIRLWGEAELTRRGTGGITKTRVFRWVHSKEIQFSETWRIKILNFF